MLNARAKENIYSECFHIILERKVLDTNSAAFWISARYITVLISRSPRVQYLYIYVYIYVSLTNI